jgi:hypothetical protein
MKRILQGTCVLFLMVLLAAQGAQAQSGGTYRMEVGGAAALRSNLPFWLHARQYGTLDPQSTGGYARMDAARIDSVNAWFAYTVKGSVLARASEHSTVHFNEIYAAARAGFIQVRVGRKHEIIGTVDAPLSSGALGTSGNAIPVPKIVVATTGYTDAPLTQGYLEFKGYWSHGWLGDERFVEGAYLHQKNAYLRMGGDLPVNVYGGLVHNAFWGGTSPAFGALPASFNDYWRTVLALSGSEEAPEDDRVYIQGNHLGVYDVGLTLDVGDFRVLAYRHFIFEDRDNLKFKSPQDGLLGLSIADQRTGRFLDHLTYEYLYTKWQNGPIGPGGVPRGGPGGRDNYYNHGIYRSGWTYFGRTVGSPLLTPVPGPEHGIANNRVVGHHIGIAGHVHATEYRLLATYTRNYGTYSEPYNPMRSQYSLALDTETDIPGAHGINLLATLALDQGSLYGDNVGVRIGVAYDGNW